MSAGKGVTLDANISVENVPRVSCIFYLNVSSIL